MLDVAEAQGIEVDPQALERALGCPWSRWWPRKTAASGNWWPPHGPRRREGTGPSPHPRDPSGPRRDLRKIARRDRSTSNIPTRCAGRTRTDGGRPGSDEDRGGRHPGGGLEPHPPSSSGTRIRCTPWWPAVTSGSSPSPGGGVAPPAGRGSDDRPDRPRLTRPLFGIPILFAILALVFAFTYRVSFPCRPGWSASSALRPACCAPSWPRCRTGWAASDRRRGRRRRLGADLPADPPHFLCRHGASGRWATWRGHPLSWTGSMHLIGLHGKSFLPCAWASGATCRPS